MTIFCSIFLIVSIAAIKSETHKIIVDDDLEELPLSRIVEERDVDRGAKSTENRRHETRDYSLSMVRGVIFVQKLYLH